MKFTNNNYLLIIYLFLLLLSHLCVSVLSNCIHTAEDGTYFDISAIGETDQFTFTTSNGFSYLVHVVRMHYLHGHHQLR